MRLAWMERFINSGLFVPSPGEDRRSQMQRFWKQINLQRMKRGLNPDAVPYTCCWCGQVAARATQAGTNKVNFGTRQDGCPNGPVHTSGWGLLLETLETCSQKETYSWHSSTIYRTISLLTTGNWPYLLLNFSTTISGTRRPLYCTIGFDVSSPS